MMATVLAMEPDNKVLDVVSYAWAGLGASLGPAILVSLYWRRMTARGALAGVLTGGATVMIWSQAEGGIFDLYALVPGFVLSLVAIVTVSLIDKRRVDSSTEQSFEDMHQQVIASK
jgi:sodium/proline symporter